MNVPRTLPACLLALVLAVSSPEPASAQALPPTGFEVGEPFPTLALPALEDGRPRSVADFRGEKIILHVFASW